MAGNDNYYPSVIAVERAFPPGNATPANVPTSGAFVGRADQGPVTPTLVTNWTEFVRMYGTVYTDLHYAVHDFFSNGGRSAYVIRLAGSGAAPAELDVLDTTAPVPPEGGETPLFTATAISPGAWGNSLRLVVTTRDAANYRFDVSLFRLPTGVSAFDPDKRNTELLVDSWLDVSLFPDDPRYLYTIANRPSSTGSQYVTFSGVTYDPHGVDRPMPGVAGGVAFTGGLNGSYIAPYDPAEAMASAIELLAVIDSPLVLNLPNVVTPAIVSAAVQWAAERGNVFVVIDPPFSQTPAQVIEYANTDLGLGGFGTSTPSYGAVYYPWVVLPAIGATIPGRTTLRPPGGAVAGRIVATDLSIGAFRAPAGPLVGNIVGGVEIERSLTEDDLAQLNSNNVNVIRPVPSGGVSIMGTRTLKKSGKDLYINVRRAVQEITSALKARTAFAIFENNNETLWSQLDGVCRSFLLDYWQRGGLKGATAEEAFYVRCDSSNNGPSSIDQGVVNVEVGVALSTPAEFVIITIGQFEGGSSATTSI